MILQSEAFSLRRARLLTLVVVAVVTTAIALANLSSEPVTSDWLKWYAPNKPAERAYGWPLTWYWRSAAQYVPPVQNVPKPTWGPVLIRWPISHYRMAFLAVNLAIWLALLAALLIGCEWLLRRYRPRLPRRPRVLTLIVLLMVSAPMVLANLSFVSSRPKDGYLGEASYGWPLIWYWHVDRFSAFTWERAWDYRAAGLAANLVLWILMLIAIGLTCEWVFRRRRPRLSFSLRTMLVGVALFTVVCAWYAAARNRALEQDAVAALLKESGVYYERWGPKWLDLVGADRFRRRIVGVRVDQEAMNDELFEQLARLPGLRFLELDPYLYDTPFLFTPGMAAALGAMRQLRMLSVNCLGDDPDKSFAAMDECLAAIGKLTQLERLRLSMWEEDTDDLGFLANLANLKTFILDMSEDSDEGETDDWASTLAKLPLLPRLEMVDLPGRTLGDDDLDQLARFPGLKSLDLSMSSVSDAGLARLAMLESLEELAIDEFMATEAGFESLVGLKRLKAIHIAGPADDWTVDRVDELPLSDGIDRALAALRQSHPGIVIDARYREFKEKSDLKPPWTDRDPLALDAFVRRWLYEP